MAIVHDDGVLGGEPRIEGTRIGVRHVAAHVVDGDRSPAYVAEQFELSMAEVHEALAYFYDNREEIRAIERENQEAFEQLRSSTLKPPENVQ